MRMKQPDFRTEQLEQLFVILYGVLKLFFFLEIIIDELYLSSSRVKSGYTAV